MPKYTHKVTFSTDRETFSHLEARARQAGLTPHQVARELVEAKMSGREENILTALNILALKIEQLEQQSEESRQAMEELKSNLKRDLPSLGDALNKLAERLPAGGRK